MCIYKFKTTQDKHWKSLFKGIHLGCTGDSRFDMAKFFEDINERLKRFDGALIIKDERTFKTDGEDWWLSGIEFETEEDLVAFKLTFN